MDHTKANHL